MNNFCWITPHKSSQLPITHPAFGYSSADRTDVAETIRRHAPVAYGDDYDLTENTSHLDFVGGFR
jgi:hypothetical protein